MLRVLAIAWALALALGCQVDDELGTQSRPIVLGTPDTDEAHAAVVAITMASDSLYFCTGTLIRRSVVLTAGHCLEGLQPDDIEVFFGNDSNTGDGEYRAVADIQMHPDYDPFELLADIALIRLAEKAPAGITPIRNLPKSKGLTTADEGAPLVFSGFGLDEDNGEGIKLRVDGTISLVCGRTAPCVGGLVVERSFYFSMTEGGPCAGDSGGPAFIVRDGREYVAGVTSYGDPACTEYGVNTTVSEYSGFIGDFVDDGGCAAGGSSRGPLAWMVLGMLALLRRRRR